MEDVKMGDISPDHARRYVVDLKLPPGIRTRGTPVAAEPFNFDEVKDQAMVVGSDIISFVRGVTPERREDIVNSSLLAQLAAKKKVPDMSNVYEWYEAYFDVLLNIGWVIQDRSFVTYTEESENFKAHEAILSVATSLLGPTAASFTVVKATLDALQSMSENSPWITIFNRESQSANTARFQVTQTEQNEKDEFLVSMIAFGLEAQAKLTQVLFFKFKSSEATLKHYSGKVTINSHVLSSIREPIKAKIAAFSNDYVKELPI